MQKLKPYYSLILIITGIIVVAKLLQNLVLFPIVESAFSGNSFEYLNELLSHHRLKNPDTRNLSFYIDQIPVLMNRVIFLSIVSSFFLWLILRNQKERFNSFIYDKKPAINLSILRIAVLGLILHLNFPSVLNDMIRLGPESIVAPTGWSSDIIEILSGTTFTKAIGILFSIFLIGAIIGFYTNMMLIGATITGFFVMGLPQFYGKIDSYHILWHTLLILSFSNCGASLSVDAWRKNRPQLNLSKSFTFGVPIKLIMLLLGTAYFFPGFWKFTISGFEWAFSDNLQLKLYSKWLQLEGWTPVFRVDQYPVLYQFAAFSTLVIEIGFVFALFFKKARLLFVIAALCFHLSVLYFMKIPFYAFMILYVVFIDWEKVIKKTLPRSIYIDFKRPFSSTNKVTKIIWVGGFLIFGNIVTGTFLINSWPFSVYPTFASLESDSVPSIVIQAVDTDDNLQKETIPILDPFFKTEFTSSVKLRGFIKEILNKKRPDPDQFHVLSETFIESNTFDVGLIHLQFYEIRLSTNPDVSPKSFEKTKLLFEIDSVLVKN